MAKVTYTPVADHGDSGETRQAGYTFPKGKSVEVKNKEQLERFKRNQNFTVQGEKGQAETAKDDRNLSPEPPPPPSIANMVYPSQPPGVGMKTSPVPRPEGSVEAALEAHGGDLKTAAEVTQKQADALTERAENLKKTQQASEKKQPRASGKQKASGKPKASKSKSPRKSKGK